MTFLFEIMETEKKNFNFANTISKSKNDKP